MHEQEFGAMKCDIENNDRTDAKLSLVRKPQGVKMAIFMGFD
jgi:hypothetical protein